MTLIICTSCGMFGSRPDDGRLPWLVHVDCYRCPDGYTIREEE